MKRALLLSSLLAVSGVCLANDSSFEGVGGSFRPTKGENKAIRMSSERVVLTAYANDFATRADFVFRNETGRAQTVRMGFPEGNFGDVAAAGPLRKSGFKRFATWVDGRKTPAKRIFTSEGDADGFDTYWVKTVSFAPHQTRRVRVELLSPYGGLSSWGFTRALSYSFTGSNWRGNVGESVMEVRVVQPGWWRCVASGNEQKILPFSLSQTQNSATFRHVWRNWPAKQNVTFGLERAIPNWKMDTGSYNSSGTIKTVNATRTVRVGSKAAAFGGAQGFPTDAFTRNGVTYLSVAHLTRNMEQWGEMVEPKIPVKTRFDRKTGFHLSAGTSTMHLRAGARTAQINGKTVRLGRPVLLVRDTEGASMFVPLAPVAKALGLRVSFQGQHLFSLQRGKWNKS